MATPPYAKIVTRINGGAPSGVAVLDAQPGDSVQFQLENTTAVQQARWEIAGYPPGWTAPAGWSTDSNGVIYSSAITPPSFNLPTQTQVDRDGLWGKWIPTVVINNASTDPQNDAYDENLFDLDKGAGVRIISPNGFYDLAPYEEAQFGGARAQWAGEQQHNLRVLERLAGGFHYIRTSGTSPGNVANTTMAANSVRLVQMYAIGKQGNVANQSYLAKQQMFRRSGNGTVEICNGSGPPIDLGSQIGNTTWTGNIIVNGDGTGYMGQLVGAAGVDVDWNVVVKYIEQSP